MSALSILFLVLPFPLAFIIHEAEEIAVQKRWMSRHHDLLKQKFPRLRPLTAHLAKLGTKAFAVAAAEELLIVLAVTALVLIQYEFCMQIWSAIFIAFSLHLIVHILQAAAVKGYVPGLVSAVFLLPYSAYGLYSIHLAMSLWEMLAWGTAGLVFMALNLMFAHKLGLTLTNERRH